MSDDPEFKETVVVPIAQNPLLPKRRLKRVVDLFPPGQFLRYLCVGGFNTLFGYGTFALVLMLLNRAMPQHLLYLTAMLASVISTPLNITVAYFGYKFFVFKTKGNYLLEWLKAFAVYGTGMVPGLLALGALTRLLQGMMGKASAGYVAGAIVIGVSTIYSFVGHKKVTFKSRDQGGSIG